MSGGENARGEGAALPPHEPSLDDLGVEPGLCADCVHRRLASSGKSIFLRCDLARTDPAFPRYPPLPVFACAGHSKPGFDSG